MTSDAQQRRDRREEILTAAEELVATAGLGAVSVRSVAERAGIGASTLRYWFPSQAALVTALARRRVDPQLQDRQIADTSLPAADRLTECLAQFLPATDDQIPLLEQWAALLTAAVGPTATPLGQATYAGGVHSAADRVQTWLTHLVDEGALPPGRAATAVPMLLTRIDGLCLGLLPTGTVPDLATALTILRADVDALLAPTSRNLSPRDHHRDEHATGANGCLAVHSRPSTRNACPPRSTGRSCGP